ncbi:MAG: hypothetical protein PHP21_04095, partial [Patescibacteria group bacterium]|nr:hypothetical protein [Patescibacteria group bacterium]
VAVFIDTQMEWLRDWMVKGGIDYVITNNSSAYNTLKKDPILKHKKIILLKHLKNLNKELKNIYQKHYDEKSHIKS